MPTLYSGADALVLPSFGEGFGLPVIEAMACGAPVVTSNLSALREVAEEAALLVDPYSKDAIPNALFAVLTDAGVRRCCVAAGLRNVQKYSWQQLAVKTLELYQLVANNT